MNTETKSSTITTVLIIALLALAGGSIKLYLDRTAFKEAAESAALKNDSLIAVNQQLEKDHFNITKKNNALTNRVVYLNDLLEKSNMKGKKAEMEKDLQKKIPN